MNEHSYNIPDIFYSEKTEKEFTNCSLCNTPLEEVSEGYLIEKAYRTIKQQNIT